MRIDDDINDEFQDGSDEDLNDKNEKLSSLFKKELKNDELKVKVVNLKNDSVASMITLSEESRRMQDMMRMYSVNGIGDMGIPSEETLVLNAKNNLVEYLLDNEEGEHVGLICEQLYDLAMLSHKQLDSDAMTKFIQRTNEILGILAK